MERKKQKYGHLKPQIKDISHEKTRTEQIKGNLKRETGSFNCNTKQYHKGQLYQSMNRSSSSCRAASTDIPDPLSSILPILHCVRLVFRDTSRNLT